MTKKSGGWTITNVVLILVIVSVFISIVSSAPSNSGSTKKPKSTTTQNAKDNSAGKKSTTTPSPTKPAQQPPKPQQQSKPQAKKPKEVKDITELVSAKSPVINVDNDRYNKFFKLPIEQDRFSAKIDVSKRSYGSILFFTGPKTHCHVCHILDKTFRSLAKLYHEQYIDPSSSYSSSDLRLYFAVLDPKRASEGFKEFKVSQLPIIVLIPPFAGPFAARGAFTPRIYPIATMNDITSVKRMSNWILEETSDMVSGSQPNSAIKIHIPVPWYENETVLMGIFGFICLLGLIQIPFVIRNIYHPYLWFCVGMVVFAFGFGGTVFNSMRPDIPVYTTKEGGGIQLFASGLRSQHRAEGYVMAAGVMVMSAVWVFMTIGVKRIGGGRLVRWTVFAVSLGVEVYLALWSVKVFSTHKMPGYPFETSWPQV